MDAKEPFKIEITPVDEASGDDVACERTLQTSHSDTRLPRLLSVMHVPPPTDRRSILQSSSSSSTSLTSSAGKPRSRSNSTPGGERQRNEELNLHIAAQRGPLSELQRLLDEGGAVNGRSRLERTPLHVAALSGNTNAIELLISRDALVDCRDVAEQTPLHLAAYKGHVDALMSLLLHNADCRLRDRRGRQALHIAAREGRHRVLLPLIEHAVKSCEGQMLGVTPLEVSQFEHSDGSSSNECKTDLRSSIAMRKVVNERDEHGMTPLILSAGKGRIESVRVLLASRANVNLHDRKGGTPLAHAICSNCGDSIRELYAAGARCTFPMCLAVQGNYCVAIQALLECGECVNGAHQDDFSPLYFAAWLGKLEAARTLVAHGADINCRDGQGMPPLERARLEGHTALVELLESHGAEGKRMSKKGSEKDAAGKEEVDAEQSRPLLARLCRSCILL